MRIFTIFTLLCRLAASAWAAPPTPLAQVSPAAGRAPLLVVFDASHSSDPDDRIVDYAWHFGDDTTDTGPVVIHRYDNTLSRSPTLTVTDVAGNAATIDVPLTILPANGVALPICGDEGEAQPLLEHCPRFEVNLGTQLYRVPGTGPVNLRFDFTVRRASYPDGLGLFRVDDTGLGIDGLWPGDPGYYGAILGRRATVFPNGSTPASPDVSLPFQGGDLLAFFIGTFDVGRPEFFSWSGLNDDRAQHFLGYRSDADNLFEFGFEDVFIANADFNYTDVVYQVDPPLDPLLGLPVLVGLTADTPTVESGARDGFTVSVRNSEPVALDLATLVVTLPEGFRYTAGSSTGLTTNDPTVVGGVATWSGPFHLPAQSTVTLHLGVRVALVGGTYYADAHGTAAIARVARSGNSAKIVVEQRLLDDFLCYKTKPGTAVKQTAQFHDEFGTADVRLARAVMLCDPLAPAHTPEHRLMCFKAKTLGPKVKRASTIVHASNRISGSETVKTGASKIICLPARADGLVSDAPLDSFRCYQGKSLDSAQVRPARTRLADAYLARDFALRAPRTYCTAAAHADDGVIDPSQRLRCFGVKPQGRPRFSPVVVADVQTDFSRTDVSVRAPKMLCVSAASSQP